MAGYTPIYYYYCYYFAIFIDRGDQAEELYVMVPRNDICYQIFPATPFVG